MTASPSSACAPVVTQFLTEHPKTLRILAWQIAKAHRLPPLVSWEDLMQEGAMGLMDAARRYDPTRGAFATYAEARARYAMLDAMRRGVWRSLEDAPQPRPMERRRAQIARVREYASGPAQAFERTEWVNQAVHQLPSALQAVLYWVYIKDQPIKDLGRLWGVTESRISQMHTEAKQRLARILCPEHAVARDS